MLIPWCRRTLRSFRRLTRRPPSPVRRSRPTVETLETRMVLSPLEGAPQHQYYGWGDNPGGPALVPVFVYRDDVQSGHPRDGFDLRWDCIGDAINTINHLGLGLELEFQSQEVSNLSAV